MSLKNHASRKISARMLSNGRTCLVRPESHILSRLPLPYLTTKTPLQMRTLALLEGEEGLVVDKAVHLYHCLMRHSPCSCYIICSRSKPQDPWTHTVTVSQLLTQLSPTSPEPSSLVPSVARLIPEIFYPSKCGIMGRPFVDSQGTVPIGYKMGTVQLKPLLPYRYVKL